MNKKLTAKVQKISPELPERAKSFSGILLIEPENQDLVLRKGVMYVVFDIFGPNEFDTALIIKVIKDVLHDSYYQSDNISPIQSLEKSIINVKDTVTKLAGEAKEFLTEFNILAGVLWGNVMYVVQFGKGKSYLMRGGEIRTVNTNVEGNFSAASGVVKEDDVIIFCSHEFSQMFPLEKLLSGDALNQKLTPDSSCFMLKFLIDTTFSEAEVINFGPSVKKAVRVRGIFSNLMSKFPKKFLGIRTRQEDSLQKKMSAEIPSYLKNLTAKTADVITIPSRTQNRLNLNLLKNSGIQKSPKLTSIVVAIMLALSIIISIKYKGFGNIDFSWFKHLVENKQKAPTETGEQKQLQEAQQMQQALESTTAQTQSQNTTVSIEVKTQRVKANVFYDVQITNQNASTTEIAVAGQKVIVADKTSGRIYVSDVNTPKFVQADGVFPEINSITTSGNKIGFAYTNGYATYDPTTNKTTETYTQGGLGISSTYLGYIYSISKGVLSKYTKNGTKLDASVWAQDPDFDEAKSMAISISIYVLKSDSTLVSYTKGLKDTFVVSGLDKPLSNAIQILTNIDISNMYIADKGNKRIVVLSKEGKFIKQIKTENEEDWNDIRGIGVNDKETKLYVLNGSKVYDVTL